MLSFCYIVFRQHKIVSFKTVTICKAITQFIEPELDEILSHDQGEALLISFFKDKSEMHVCVCGTAQIHKSHHLLGISHTAASARSNVASSFFFFCHNCSCVTVRSFQSEVMQPAIYYLLTFTGGCYVFLMGYLSCWYLLATHIARP